MKAKLSRYDNYPAGYGFSLVELMIAVAVVAILVTLSYPTYIHYVLKADRTDAQMTLRDWANRQEVWRADHPTYNTGINPQNSAEYTYSMVSTADSFTLTATAVGRQAADKEEGISCATLTLRQDGSPGPAGHQACWAK
jgi:type IV pilus assembly protein PilE